ncbi:hypothetical protein L1987_87883 [Smallanthus sonchifolius]|nr:hypothetical protein L1987_87883 [Smallanthus sonchifolius]
MKKLLSAIPTYDQFQTGFCNQNLNFDLVLGQNWNPNSLVMQFEPSEIKGMDWITDTTSQPSDWIFPFQLQMVNDQNHCVHAPSSSVKHAEEIDTETDLNLDVDLPPLPLHHHSWVIHVQFLIIIYQRILT